jgi:N-acetylglucosaminyldiphosphoundecaprenol N-acetyl-beta-D-mannosaminyltransferase
MRQLTARSSAAPPSNLAKSRLARLDVPTFTIGVRQVALSTGDDLSRDVHCILGIPIDAIEMQPVLDCIKVAAAERRPFLISTVNLNFLIIGQTDSEFRESLLRSDLCTADGMPVIWIARLLGSGIENRVAGSDMFEELKADRSSVQPLKVFLFGGAEGVAMKACESLNRRPHGIYCAGFLYPGFGSFDEMSTDDIIERINASNSDFLVASLGAKKGQSWLLRNHHRFLIPIRAHLGATMNFEVGAISRSPVILRKFGLEWLWRIKEEPSLWKRYLNDGGMLLRLLLTRIVPLALWLRSLRRHHGRDFIISRVEGGENATINLSGPAVARHVHEIIPLVREAIESQKQIVLDFSDVTAVDTRFLGLLLMLQKTLRNKGARPTLTGLSPRWQRMFALNGLDFPVS